MSLTLEIATPAHRAEVDALLEASYTALLSPAYSSDLLARALPRITRAQDALLSSGRYVLLRDGAGHLVGAGGITLGAPGTGDRRPGLAHIRHVAVDPAHTGKGVGRHLLTHLLNIALSDGAARVEALSTLNAEPFYAAMGFRRVEALDVALGDLPFPSIRMHRYLD